MSKDTPESKLHFLDYWRVIRIRKTVIIAVFLLVLVTTIGVTVLLPKTYESTTRIEVGKNQSDVPGLWERDTAVAYDPYFMQTEFQKIQSKEVLYNVISNLGLNEKWGKKYGVQGGLTTLRTYNLLLDKIDLKQTRNTSLIEVHVYSNKPEEAAVIANEIADTYKQFRLKQVKSVMLRGIETIEEKLVQQSEKVKEAQNRVDKLKEELKISDAIVTGSGGVSTLEPETVRKLENARIDAQTAYIQWSTMAENLKSLTPSELRQAAPTAVNDNLLSTLLSAQFQTEQELTQLKTEMSENHPDVIRIKSQLETINAQIKERLGGIINGLEARAASMKAQMAEAEKEVEQAKQRDIDATKKYRPYFIAKRDLETQETIRRAMMMKVMQERVSADLPRSSVVVVTDLAEPGLRPVRPNLPLNIALGIVVGLVVGVGLAFFIEYLDTSVKTIDDVEKSLQSPVLGVIPQNVGPLIAEGPDSPHAEAYRVLRTNLMFSRDDNSKNVITVVSGGAGEGKTTTVVNLATVFAQSGSRVLVVDSDLRRPAIHKVLNVSNSVGLTNYLLDQQSLEEVIQTTSLPTLDFLPSGKLPSSAMGILSSIRMQDFVKEVKQRYDFVFFDSPPIMGVSDASVLASEADMTVLIVQYRKYPQIMTLRAKQMVEKVGKNLMGVVLNNINISQDSYYYYYSGYYYDYYSKYEYGGSSKSDDKENTGREEGQDDKKVEVKSK
ncbi:MAG: polysaccharide biosynthesis tyrosine autokinase, partial [Verrucomicrobia bacterium]|nr:polysaccharide biosynthesis tyrosine autokinase [Verrucomicrobiota bacterium]